VVCTKTSIDSETNNVSLFEVIEQVQISTVPEAAPDTVTMAVMPMECVSLWMREPITEPQHGECRLALRGPRGASVSSAPQALDLSKYRRFRSRLRLPGLPIDGLGLCEIEVQFRPESEAEWNTVARVPIEVTAQESPTRS